MPPNLPIPGTIPQQVTEQQLQIQQELAQALQKIGMEDVAPTIRGAPGNPYSRDTINIGGMVRSLLGATKGHSMQEGVNKDRLQLAREVEKSYQEEIEKMFGGKTNMKEAAMAGLKSPNATVRALASTIMGKQFETEEKQLVTGATPAEWAKAGLDQADLTGATKPGFFTGAPIYNPQSGMVPQRIPKDITVPPESRVVQVNENRAPPGMPPPGGADVVTSPLPPQNIPTGVPTGGGGIPAQYSPEQMAGLDAKRAALRAEEMAGAPGTDRGVVPPLGGELAGADAGIRPGGPPPLPAGLPPPGMPPPGRIKEIVSPIPPEVIQPGEMSRDGTYRNPHELPVTKDPVRGTYEVMKGAEGLPSSVARKDAGAYAAKALPEGQELQLKAKRAVSRIGDVMKLAHERAIYGLTAEWQLKARRLAVDLGMSNDEAGRISASQTAVARLMITAAQGTKEITPRASQQLINAELEAAGASKEVDARHVIDIGGAMIGDILNSRDDWNQKIVPTFAKTPFGAHAHDYKVEYPDPDFKGLPVLIEKNERGDWVNRGMVESRGVHRPGMPTPDNPTANPYQGKSDAEIRQLLGQ